MSLQSRLQAAIVLLAVAASASAAADPVRREKDFAAANQRALKGDHAGAAALYRHLLDGGLANEDVYFNLGNSLALSDDKVGAVVAYERAIRLAPGDTDARENLSRVRAKLEVEPPEEPADLVDWIEPLVAPLSRDLFAWLALIANALLFGALTLRRFSQSARLRGWAGLLSTAAFVTLLLAGTVTLGHAMVARDARAVVLEAHKLKAGPDPKFEDTAAVKAGERLRVLDREGEFREVKTMAGVTGWTKATSIESI